MSKTIKSYPYKGTTVEVEASRSDIDKILQKYGIRGTQWTTIWDEGKIELRFPVEFEHEGVKKGAMVSLKPPMFFSEHRSYDPRKGYIRVKAPDYRAAMRALYFYIKSMMEAINYGLVKVEEAFMSQILVSLPGGKETTLGETMKRVMVKEGQLEKITRDALPERDDSKVIDAEVVE